MCGTPECRKDKSRFFSSCTNCPVKLSRAVVDKNVEEIANLLSLNELPLAARQVVSADGGDGNVQHTYNDYLRGGLPTKTLHWKNGRGQCYPKASDADCLTYLRQILCLGEALEVVGGLPEWMVHDLLRVLAVRRVTSIGALPEGWMILLAHSIGVHGEV